MAYPNLAEQNMQSRPEGFKEPDSDRANIHHGLIDSIPFEIKYDIVKDLILPRQPCPAHLFGRCYDPWSCPLDHPDLDTRLPRVTPEPRLNSLCPFILTQGHDAFFRHNLFVLKSASSFIVERDLPNPPSTTHEPRHRDSRASRIVDFLDYPVWRGDPLTFFFSDSSYDHVDQHRHKIRHLALVYDKKYTFWCKPHECGNWMFSIDWESLKHLETLYLDFRKWGDVFSKERGNWRGVTMWRNLKRGLGYMKSVKLQSLILVGLCSPSIHGPVLGQKQVEGLFTPLLKQGGKLNFWDCEELW